MATALISLSTFSLAETRGFVVSFLHATGYSNPDNCPLGGNGGSSQAQFRSYKAAGFSKERLAAVLRGEEGPSNGARLIKARMLRARYNGKPARVTLFPGSLPDPHMETVVGPQAFGFDLDGKGPDTPNTFEDPETHEKGVDNQLFRALGCFVNYSSNLPIRPLGEQDLWRSYLPLVNPPAWVLSITGSNFENDSDVSVSFYRAVEHLRYDRSGQGLADITYTVEPSDRTYGHFNGSIKNGIFTSEPDSVNVMLAGEFPTFTKFDLKNAQLRLTLGVNRMAEGYIAGYQPWKDFLMRNNHTNEDQGTDHVALYHTLKRMADAEPDPETGQNTAISATYRIEAVPAFLVRPDGAFITDAN